MAYLLPNVSRSQLYWGLAILADSLLVQSIRFEGIMVKLYVVCWNYFLLADILAAWSFVSVLVCNQMILDVLCKLIQSFSPMIYQLVGGLLNMAFLSRKQCWAQSTNQPINQPINQSILLIKLSSYDDIQHDGSRSSLVQIMTCVVTHQAHPIQQKCIVTVTLILGWNWNGYIKGNNYKIHLKVLFWKLQAFF